MPIEVREGLVCQTVGESLLVYDPRTGSAHELIGPVRWVFEQSCEGMGLSDLPQAAEQRLEWSESDLRAVLGELAQKGLIRYPVSVSRRQVLTALGVAIISVAAPLPAAAKAVPDPNCVCESGGAGGAPCPAVVHISRLNKMDFDEICSVIVDDFEGALEYLEEKNTTLEREFLNIRCHNHRSRDLFNMALAEYYKLRGTIREMIDYFKEAPQKKEAFRKILLHKKEDTESSIMEDIEGYITRAKNSGVPGAEITYTRLKKKIVLVFFEG